jgi:hypothetical protein
MVRHLPGFVSLVAGLLGLLDLVRGAMHTVFLDHAARAIAGLDLSLPNAIDQLQLMMAFGASNLITGAALILAAVWDRRIAWILLAVIPVAYLVGTAGFQAASEGLPASTAAWGGKPMMRVYLVVCVVTFLAGGLAAWRRARG